MEWIACRVTTGKEYEIRAKLKKIDEKAEIYIPRRHYIEMVKNKVQDKSERMLPGYLLIGTETGLNPLLIKTFLKYIGKVTQEEIEHLRACEGSKQEYLEVGSKILVIEGPFQGCKGTIEFIEEEDYKVRLVFHGMDIPVTLKESFINVIQLYMGMV